MSYLRFTPPEYRAIAHAFRSLAWSEDSFPDFKFLLVQALIDNSPELAKRIALFRNGQLRILFDHLRQRQEQRKRPARGGLTTEEFQALAGACHSLLLRHRFLGLYKQALVRHFRSELPTLARKLVRMSDDRFRELYDQIRDRKRKS